MPKLYDGYGNTVMTDSDKLAAIASISVEYGRASGASYCFVRIPKYTIDGKRIKPKVAITSADGSVSGSKVSALTFAKRENTVFTINAGLFNTSTRQPQGQTIIDGISITNTPMTDDMGVAISDDECYPLCIDANGDFSAPYERSVDTATMIAGGVKYAVTAWGQFIENFAKADVSKYNEIVHAGKYIRQSIGQFQNGDYFVCTVDMSRGAVTNEAGMTYDTLADLLISKGVKFAYSLDGGGSCETVIGNRQINPIYEGEVGRSVSTVIYFTTDAYPVVDIPDATVYWWSAYGLTGGTYGTDKIMVSQNTTRMTAYSKNDAGLRFMVSGAGTVPDDMFPISIPDWATKVRITVPTGYRYGYFLWEFDESSIVKALDSGWKTTSDVYDLAEYPNATHIAVNVAKTDNAEIEESIDTSGFSVEFE